MNIEKERKQRDELIKTINELIKVEPSELMRVELGNELSFEKGNEIIKSYLNFMIELSNCNFNEIPIQIINKISQAVNYAEGNFKAIREFSLQRNGESPIRNRDQILNNLQDNYSNTIEQLSCIIQYFKPKLKIEYLENEGSRIIEELTNIKKEISTEKVKTSKELNEILETARQTVSEVGVSNHAIHFKLEADDNLKSSKSWLIALFLCITITIGWGIACFFIHPISGLTSDILQFTIAKVIIISGLYYALTTITKNYKAHRHNYIVNKHKQNSLNSFEAFVKGSGDDIQTKNAILISATQSIFSAQPSGYSNQDTENESNKFIEIIKTAQTSK